MDNTIIIGSDHGGFELKSTIIAYLEKEGYRLTDVGTHSAESCDYPDLAFQVSEKVSDGSFPCGIVICTSGIGVSMCANKSKGVRAALCTTVEHAVLSRQHNDANVLALGSKFTNSDLACEIVSAWLSTAFEGGRHSRRVDKIQQFEEGEVA